MLSKKIGSARESLSDSRVVAAVLLFRFCCCDLGRFLSLLKAAAITFQNRGLVEEAEHGGLLRADARLASPFCRQRRVHGTARHLLAVPVAHPRGCGWLRHCALAASGADGGAVPTNFLLLRAHFLLCVSVVMAPLIEEYLVLLLSLRIITCRSSRHV